MRRHPRLAILMAASLTAAAAGALAAPPEEIPPPLIDMKSVNKANYDRDLAECRTLAQAVIAPKDPPPATKAGKLKAGVVGAAKASAKAVANNGLNVVKGAGSVVRDVSGQTAADRSKAILANCLKGRGYAVLE